MGHKPLEEPPLVSEEEDKVILNISSHPFGDHLKKLFDENSKVRLYCASYSHSWHAFPLRGGSVVWQIISGNGGAPLEKKWSPKEERHFGFAVLDLHRSGTIEVSAYGRPLPPPPQQFYEDHPVAPEPARLYSTVVVQNRREQMPSSSPVR